jgi:hypothetical protein
MDCFREGKPRIFKKIGCLTFQSERYFVTRYDDPATAGSRQPPKGALRRKNKGKIVWTYLENKRSQSA